MALRNLFGDVALEATQLDIKLDHGEALLEILKQLRIMNTHLAAISGERVNEHDVEGEHYDS
jgi:hypothetical protein